MDPLNDDQQPDAGSGSVGKTAAMVAIAALAMYVVAIVYLAVRAALGAQEMEWTRDMYLFGGLEAIGFAAAGLFFGHQIQRQRVDEANRREARMRKLYITGVERSSHEKARNAAERAVTLDRITLLRTDIDALIQQRKRGVPRSSEEAQEDLAQISLRLDQWFPAEMSASTAATTERELVGSAQADGRVSK